MSLETDSLVPEVRQQILLQRLQADVPLSATHLAEEFCVSLDTIRRDFIALEHLGHARRVRGGLLPVVSPAEPMARRLETPHPALPKIAARAAALIAGAKTILFDGGTTALAVAQALPDLSDRLIITPAPRVAMAFQDRGAEVYLIGGTLSPRGGIATGGPTLAAVQAVAADVAVLGACGVDAAFGLSADDAAEAQVKTAMAQAATRTLVVTGAEKLGRRARHRALPPEDIDQLVTEARAADLTHPLAVSGTEIFHV